METAVPTGAVPGGTMAACEPRDGSSRPGPLPGVARAAIVCLEFKGSALIRWRQCLSELSTE